MILNFIDDIQKFFSEIPMFIEENFSNPVFWILIVSVIVIITTYAINDLGSK